MVNIIAGLPWAVCLILYAHGASSSASGPPTHGDALISCLARANVPLLIKHSSEWTHEITPYNLRLNYTPAAVAVPQSVGQIQAAVSCGAKSKVRVSAKGGGHSFGSLGLGGEDGHLVIALDRMRRITLNHDHTAKIQPGARLASVAAELYSQGQRAISHGSCPGVGIAGHVLHGGFGFASRTHGLTLDWLIGATVVLADGSAVHCSATENKDLFWALRGAGSSFGIVAEFEFDTFQAPHQVTPFAIELPWNQDQAARGILALQKFVTSAPKEINLMLYMTPTVQSILGVYYGDQTCLNETVRPLLDEINGKISPANTTGWIDGLKYFDFDNVFDHPYPYNSHDTFYATSPMVRSLNASQAKSLMSALFANKNDPSARHSWSLFVEVHGGDNSAVKSVSSSATAYVHRDKLFLFHFEDQGLQGQYLHPGDGFALLKKFGDSITNHVPHGDWGVYANYLDTQLDGETAQKLYWGDNLPRLQRIKAQLDPNQVFWNYQGVRPAKYH